MHDADDDLLRRLLHQPPGEVEAWLAANVVPDDFNWRGLAEVAASNALWEVPGDRAVSLGWARVAQLAHSRLVGAEADEYERRRSTEAVMRLRAELINRFGTVPGDPFLDCDEIVQWFLGRHDPAFDAVAADAGHWTSLPIERIRALRAIKNELSVLRLLAQCPASTTPEAQRWLALWPQLP
jgi:hypothetical protein